MKEKKTTPKLSQAEQLQRAKERQAWNAVKEFRYNVDEDYIDPVEHLDRWIDSHISSEMMEVTSDGERANMMFIYRQLRELIPRIMAIPRPTLQEARAA